MKIGIIVAMQSELECVRCLLENPREEQHGSSLFIIGTNGKHELILTQSGIGKVSSAIRTYELIDRYAPDCILNTGVAGGIDRSMHVMDIVVGSEIVYHDVWCGEDCAWGQIDGLPAQFHSDPALVEKALKVSTDLSLYKGLVCSGDRFITDPAELSQIKGLFPEGMAVDMESGAIAQICYIYKVPRYAGIRQPLGTIHKFLGECASSFFRDFNPTHQCVVKQKTIDMKKIPSFTIDHIHLSRGIYVSRKDYLGDHVVTTFDIRMKEPNREPAIGYGALHTIEHLAATFLRNHPVWGDKIVFWGPMGCCTGNYFLMQGDLESKDIVELMRETFRFIRDFDGEVPGAAPRDCGNYLLHDLPMARWEADKYLREVLDVIEEKNLVYPTIREE